MDMSFVEDIEEGFVFSKEYLVKGIFGQLRTNSNDLLEQRPSEESDCAIAGVNECKKSRPTLERTLSHETTLKRKKRDNVRMSLNEDLLNSEWAMYSPEERKILDFVVRKASMEEGKSNKGKKGSKLQQFRIHRPKLFSRNRNSTKPKRSNVPESLGDFEGKKVSDCENCNDVKGRARKSSFIRRFIDSASHAKSPSSSPKLARKTQSNGLDRSQNTSMKDASSPDQCRRRQPENPQMLTLRENDMKRSSSLQFLPRSSADAPLSSQKLQQTAMAEESNKECKEKTKLFRAQNADRRKEYKPEENDTFFEIFEHFRKNPMILLDAAEIDC